MKSSIYVIFHLIIFSQLVLSMDFFSSRGFGFNPSGNGNSNDDEYYKMLGIPKEADEYEIKRSYRKKAMTMHPDKGGDNESFKKLVEAYEVLSDPERRKLYDRYGKEGISLGSSSRGGGGSFTHGFASDLFRGFGGFSMMPIMYTIELSLEDFYKGRKLNVKINEEEFPITIEPGMFDGIELRGRITDSRGSLRDVVFVLKQKNHNIFTRKNGDLYMEMKLSLRECLLGFEKSITHLDGTKYIVKSLPGEVIGSHDVLMVKELGMPVYKVLYHSNY